MDASSPRHLANEIPLTALCDVRLCPSGSYSTAERREVVRSGLPLSIDKEGGGARDHAHVSAFHVRRDTFAPSMTSEILGEFIDIESELFRVPDEILGGQRILVFDQQVVHRPEGSLRCGRLGCLRRQLRTGMHVVQWQMTPHIT